MISKDKTNTKKNILSNLVSLIILGPVPVNFYSLLHLTCVNNLGKKKLLLCLQGHLSKSIA